MAAIPSSSKRIKGPALPKFAKWVKMRIDDCSFQCFSMYVDLNLDMETGYWFDEDDDVGYDGIQRHGFEALCTSFGLKMPQTFGYGKSTKRKQQQTKIFRSIYSSEALAMMMMKRVIRKYLRGRSEDCGSVKTELRDSLAWLTMRKLVLKKTRLEENLISLEVEALEDNRRVAVGGFLHCLD